MTYIVIEYTLKSKKLVGEYTSKANALKKKRQIKRKKTRGSFGADIFKLVN